MLTRIQKKRNTEYPAAPAPDLKKYVTRKNSAQTDAVRE